MLFLYNVVVEFNWIAIAAVCVANFTDTVVVIFLATLASAYCIRVVTIINLYIIFTVIQNVDCFL